MGKAHCLEHWRGKELTLCFVACLYHSTLPRHLRNIYRLWESGTGTISAPATKDFFILPQHPYAPLGTLKNLLLYPFFKQGSLF